MVKYRRGRIGDLHLASLGSLVLLRQKADNVAHNDIFGPII